MAFLEFRNIRVAGFAAGVPRHIESTVSTTSQYDATDFIETTGIKEKRFSNKFTTSDLCQPAVVRLLDDLGWEKGDIDALVFVSQTPDYILPATSCVLQGKLGFKKDCLALDISLGCSGWVYGLSVVLGLMQSKGVKKALLLAGDARKHADEEPDQLFGYAGTVTALEIDPSTDSSFRFSLGTDGTGYDAIIRPSGGTRNQFNEHSLDLEDCDDGRRRHSLQTRMKGMDVFSFGITTAPKSIKKLGEHFGFDYLTYDYFIFHQANKKMNDTITRKLKLDEAKVPYSMLHFGNTSSASIPLTIVTQLRGKFEHKPTKFICCGFGVGLSWGAVAFESDGNIVVSELVEVD